MSKTGNRPYIVQLSNKTEVKIDSDELPLISQGIQAGSPIRVKDGIINPSFIVAVVFDEKRWNDALETIDGFINADSRLEVRERRRINGCKPLVDVFKNSPLKLSQPDGNKKGIEYD